MRINAVWRFGGVIGFSILLFAMIGCEEEDVVSIRVKVKNDLSGTVACSSLQIPSESGALEGACQGVEWGNRAVLVCGAGSFANLSRLQIEDLSFAASKAATGLNSLQVLLPRGPAARWPKAMAPASRVERERAAEAFDPSGRFNRVGSVVKLVIDLPGKVIAHGVALRARGLKESAERSTATLIVPLDLAVTDGNPIIWQVTWSN